MKRGRFKLGFNLIVVCVLYSVNLILVEFGTMKHLILGTLRRVKDLNFMINRLYHSTMESLPSYARLLFIVNKISPSSKMVQGGNLKKNSKCLNARSIVQYQHFFIFFLKNVENPQNFFEIFIRGHQ
jgi:hypothetical protein